MKFIILPEAEKEIKDTILYYNDQMDKLGNNFFDELLYAFDNIEKYPLAWSLIHDNTRKYTLKRFPYLVLYIAEKNKIVITAVAHQHRHPDSYLK